MAKITYRDNPLNAKVELNADDKKRLRDNLENEELWSALYSANRHLEAGTNYNPVKARLYLEIRNILFEVERGLPYNNV